MMKALIVLLGCLATALAVPAHFPHAKTVTYKYTADVKAGLVEPVSFASQFGIECLLRVTHDTTDPTLKNAYHVTLTDVKHSLHNGQRLQHEHLNVMLPIDQAAKTIQEPFLIVYDENGQFQGVKLWGNESGWSKNIKQAIASLLQLDLVKIQLQTPVKTHTFTTVENTIHGNCHVEYTVQPKDAAHPNNVFLVTKFHDPQNCSHFAHHEFDQVESVPCHVEQEKSMTTGVTRMFEIEHQGTEILIKKLIGQGSINYLPWLSRAESHYLLTNQTLILENTAPVTEKPSMQFKDIEILRDITFGKPRGKYVNTGDIDVTHGRHTVNLEAIISKAKKILTEAADYLKEDHMEVKQLDWKHGQTINRLQHIMGYMDVTSLEQVYNTIQNTKDSKEVTMKQIFLGIVPKVGTTAACHFVRNVIRNKLVSDVTAVMMLSKLPMSVRLPTEELLVEMEEFLRLGETVSFEVRKASILCFATLIHETFKNEPIGVIEHNALLDKYLWHFMEHVSGKEAYHTKEVYVMAMKNVGVHKILKFLEPIIRGDLVISQKPFNIRRQAIWAIKKIATHNPQYIHDLLWPVLANAQLPLPLRIIAYDVLMTELPHISLMKVHWLMVYEKNEHLYNYHLTTLTVLARLDDPCLIPIKEMAKKVLRVTKNRDISTTLSSKYDVDYVNNKFGYGESMKTSLIVDQLDGLPHIGSIEHSTTFLRKPVNQWAIHWNINSLNEVLTITKLKHMGSDVDSITNLNAKNILLKVAQDLPPREDICIDITLTVNDNVVMALNYDKNNWMKLFDDVKQWRKSITTANVNWQNVMYDNLYEMHVPTDLGVPAVLVTKIPNVDSLKLNTALLQEKNAYGLKLEVDYRNWKHGENTMSIYNPIADVWHSVRRVSSRDIVIPLEMTISYNWEMKSLKFNLPRLPVTKYSVTGMSTHTKSYVTITSDETDMLKKACTNCHHHELATGAVGQKKLYQNVFDSKDTGLQCTMAVHDCDGTVTPVLPIGEWLDALSTVQKATWNDTLMHVIMGIRQKMTNDLISSQDASCSNLIKIAPSVIYPTSHVDLSGKFSMESLEHVHEKLHHLSSQKVNVRGTMTVKAASTNEAVRQWDVNANVDLSQGHLNNNLKVHITRMTKGEKNLKICIDAQKNYPAIETDSLKVDVSQEETNSKLTITMGQTDEDKCVRDDMDVMMTIKGQVSEEQLKHVLQESVHQVCSKQMQNPIFHAQAGYIPRTWECVKEAMLHSTLRKYTVDARLTKVPANVMSIILHLQTILQAVFLPHVRYSMNRMEQPGLVRMILQYPYSTSLLDMSVVTWAHSYDLIQLPFGHPVWNLLMDNTRFPIEELNAFVDNESKMCTIYPQVIQDFDENTIPFIVPPQWVLINGDYVGHSYAIFVKSLPNNKLALKLLVGETDLEITPGDTKDVFTVDGTVVEDPETGLMVPNDPDNFNIKLTKDKEQLIIQSEQISVTLYKLTNSVTVVADTQLEGEVAGMCGQMHNVRLSTISKIYTTSQL